MTPSRKYVFTSRLRRFPRAGKAGFTLVELLMATTLSLMLLMGVVTVFATISASVSDARAMLETADRLRATKSVLQQDLAGITVTMLPPRRPEANEGYFEVIEGPLGALTPVWEPNDWDPNTGTSKPRNQCLSFAWNSQNSEPDSTVADLDDILMFTTRRADRPFVGRIPRGTLPRGTLKSHVAEVAWFVRGRTLYRRVLLVAPHVLAVADANGNSLIDLAELNDGVQHSYYEWYDISARPVFAPGSGNLAGWVPNTLGDLTKRENRFAHWVHGTQPFPFDASLWGLLGLPVLQECSHPGWMAWTGMNAVPVAPHAGSTDPVDSPGRIWTDLWDNPHRWAVAMSEPVDAITGVLANYRGPRIAEDVILTNVIGFDVKVWDPQAPVVSDGNVVLQPGDPGYAAAVASGSYSVVSRGAYVDLGYGGASLFGGPGEPRSGLGAVYPNGNPRTIPTRIYDTWSFHYEHDGIDQFGNGTTDLGTNGMDDNNNGVVDDSLEMDTRPPYRAPLRGIQVKIRIFEPDTKQVREVTVVQDFLPK